MLKIGITGGIGSGKSFICRIFQNIGIPIYYADDESKKILQNNEYVKLQIKLNFGNDIYQENKLDKLKLANIVFNDSDKLKLLNNILHPIVFKEFNLWCSKQTSKYVIMESAIIFESGADKILDKIYSVSAPEELRIQRSMYRDKTSRQNVLQRMKNQISEEERNLRSDVIIINDDKSSVTDQVTKLHDNLMRDIR